MLHGLQQRSVQLSFELPAICAAQLSAGVVDIGLVPVGALIEQPMTIYRGTGIACRGPVRSILLISKVAFSEIRTLALDSSSRSSVLLARIILARRYGVEPELITLPPVMTDMLESADACLIIGDPALLLDPDEMRRSGFHVADLGAEWVEMTGLPMVFAVWAGRPGLVPESVFIDSWRYGMDHLDDIVQTEYARRGITPALAHEYLTEHIVFDLAEREYEGMRLYMQYAAEVLRTSSLRTTAL